MVRDLSEKISENPSQSDLSISKHEVSCRSLKGHRSISSSLSNLIVTEILLTPITETKIHLPKYSLMTQILLHNPLHRSRINTLSIFYAPPQIKYTAISNRCLEYLNMSLSRTLPIPAKVFPLCRRKPRRRCGTVSVRASW